MRRPRLVARIRHAVVRALLAVLVFAVPAAAQVPVAQPPAQFEKGLFDLRVGDLLTETVIAVVNDRGIVLLPLDEILSLTGLRALPESGDSVRVIPAFGSTTPATLDFRRGTIKRLGLTSPVAPDEAVSIGGTWYLGADRVADFLGAKVVADMSSLQIFVSREPPFPSEQFEATRERRAVYGVGPQAAQASPNAEFIRRTGGLGVDWTLSSSGAPSSQNVGLQLGLGAAVYGGSLSGSTSLTERGLDRTALGSSWQYTFATPASDWLRTVQFGNSAATTSGRSILGVVASNSRPYRGGPFSIMKVAPDAPPGWSYEVYQEGRLIGFSDASSRTPVRVQLAYGSTPVEIRFHGPAGEEVRSTYVYQVDIERLPAGRVEYGAGGGTCTRVQDCRVGFANVTAGLRSWVTASAGAEMIDSVSTRSVEPFGRLLMSTATGWKGTTEWTPSLKRARVVYFGPGRMSGSLAAGTIGDASPIASYTGALGARVFIEPAFAVALLPVGGHLPMTLRLEGRDERPRDGSRARVRFGSTIAVAEFQGSLQYSDDVPGQAPMLSTGAIWLTPPSWDRFGRLPVVASVGQQGGSIQNAQLGTTLKVREHASMNVQLQWTNGARGGPSIALTYNAFTGRLRQSVGLTSGTGQGTVTNMLIGSMATIDPPFGLTSSDRAAANTASIHGRAFYDNDGNGVFGPGDKPAEGARIEAGGLSAAVGPDGRYTIVGVLPFEPLKVVVDTAEGVDPSYVPSVAARDVRLSPNVFTRFDIPMVKTREVVGTLQGDSTIATTAGVTVELRESKTGRVYTTSTFADGTFYVSRVVPGTYQLAVSSRSLAALKAATPVSPSFPVSAVGDVSVVAPTVLLHASTQLVPRP